MTNGTAGPAQPPRNSHWVENWEAQYDPPRNELYESVQELVGLIPSAGQPYDDVRGWPFLGTVVASVQSGKTAAMVGITSHLFDMGYDLVVLKSGITNDLQVQTSMRMWKEFAQYGVEMDDGSITHPDGIGPHGGWEAELMIEPQDDFDFWLSGALATGREEWGPDWVHIAAGVCSRNRPALFVSKKIARGSTGGPVGRMVSTLTWANTVVENFRGTPLRWALIDDECDDRSVSRGPDWQVTRDRLLEAVNIGECAYVGFTATPQAVFHSQENIFYPHHVRYLRYPLFTEPGVERPSPILCYDAEDLLGTYCGSYIFHEWNGSREEDDFFHIGIDNLAESGYPHIADMNLGLAHYLVSGAIRRLIEPNLVWNEPGELEWEEHPFGTDFVKPHSMLINPNYLKNSHKRAATTLLWILMQHSDLPFGHPQIFQMIEDWGDSIPVDLFSAFPQAVTQETVANWCTDNMAWLEEIYNEHYNSHVSVRDEVNPDFPDFTDVVAMVPEVLRNTQLALLNGDSRARLSYDRSVTTTGVRAPLHAYVIAVGSNNMGRGLTVDGLCTTMYWRHGNVEDLDIQRQRWFGYRGSHLEFVRILMPQYLWQNQFDFGFRESNANLADVFYSTVVENNNVSCEPNSRHPRWSFPATPGAKLPSTVLEGIGQFTFTSACIFRFCTTRSLDEGINQANRQWVNELVDMMVDEKGMPELEWSHPHWGNTPGILCGIPFVGAYSGSDFQPTSHGERFTALEIANLLDSFQIAGHNPNREILSGRPFPYKFLTPGTQDESPWKPISGYFDELDRFDITQNDPYMIAGYLRLWHHAYADVLNGDITEDDYVYPLVSGISEPPEFNVIIRKGGSAETISLGDSHSIDLDLGIWGVNHPLPEGYTPNLMWGSAGLSVHGGDRRMDDVRDDWPDDVDLQNEQRNVPRTPSEPGLLLIYLRESVDENGDPDPNGEPIPLLLFNIPSGGPVYDIYP